MVPTIDTTPPTQDDFAEFGLQCRRLAARVIAAIRGHSSVQSVIEQSSDPVYVKAADGTLLFSNNSYESLFAAEGTPVGRQSRSYLHDSLYPLSLNSDALILSGSSELEFTHPALDSLGRAATYRTFKASLLGSGHPKMAILGISRPLDLDPTENTVRVLGLSQAWEQFSSLNARDQEIAGLIARGERLKAIAEKFEVTEKTVENRRNFILKKLSLGQQTELIKLLVRLQDSGYCDFGL